MGVVDGALFGRLFLELAHVIIDRINGNLHGLGQILHHSLDQKSAFLVENADEILFFLAVHACRMLACPFDGRLDDRLAGFPHAGGEGFAHDLAGLAFIVHDRVQNRLKTLDISSIEERIKMVDADKETKVLVSLALPLELQR